MEDQNTEETETETHLEGVETGKSFVATKSLLDMDRGTIISLVMELLDSRVREHDLSNYVIVDGETILIKSYANRPIYRGFAIMKMTIKAKLINGKLHIVEAW